MQAEIRAATFDKTNLPPTFGAVLEGHARGNKAGETAISYGDQTITWSELNRRTSARARRLKALGVKPDDFVAICLPNGIEHHVTSFSAWRAGATACILPTKLPGRELSQLLDLAQPSLLVREDDEPVAGIPRMAPSADEEMDGPAPDYAASYWKALTSGGSTGRPKLIVDHAAARYDERLAGITALLRIPSGGVILNPGPLSHNAPFLCTSLALFAGTRVVGMNRFDPEEALRLIERERVEWVCMVPTMMQRIWNLPAEVKAAYDLSSLRCVLHLGAPCPRWLKRDWIDWLGADRILELYAGTEGAAILISGEEWIRKPGSVGKAADGAITILDDEGRTCAPDVIGEIFFSAETAAKFHYVGSQPKLDASGRLSLGDLGFVDEDGYLFLSDRRTDLIIRGGANVYPAEVEAALIEHPAILDAVVIGLPCADLGARVHAILQLSEPIALEELDLFLSERLARYKCPQTYEITDGVLRDEAGKVRRTSLRDARLAGVDEAGPPSTQSPSQTTSHEG